MKKEKLNFNYRIIALAIVFLIIGIILGIFYQSQKINQQLQKVEGTLKILNSEVVPSIVSYGKVTNIDGRKITMAFNDDSITIKIKDDALIRFLSSSNNKNVNPKEVGIDQIKVGDMVNVKTVIDTEGSFEGTSVIDFSQNNDLTNNK